MARLVVSTVGTSLLTNGADPALLSLLRRTANARPGDLAPAERGRLDSLIAERRRRLETAGPVEARPLSAELNGLLAIPEVLEGQAFAAAAQHLLVATDTAQGGATAELVRDWIRSRDGVAELLRVPDLRTDSLAGFRVALSQLADQLLEQAQGWRVTLNLTGGFKSVNAYLQAVAVLQDWETVFLFEGAKELLRVPRLPVVWDVAGSLAPHVAHLRRLRAAGQLPLDELREVPESLLFAGEEKACLSEWGTALLDQVCREIYRQELQPPAVPELLFTKGFRKGAERLAADDLAKLNRQLDALARWLATDRRENVKSLDVKRLRGDPSPPSTHEVDAWTGTGKRPFGHLEDGRFVVDRLGEHL